MGFSLERQGIRVGIVAVGNDYDSNTLRQLSTSGFIEVSQYRDLDAYLEDAFAFICASGASPVTGTYKLLLYRN